MSEHGTPEAELVEALVNRSRSALARLRDRLSWRYVRPSLGDGDGDSGAVPQAGWPGEGGPVSSQVAPRWTSKTSRLMGAVRLDDERAVRLLAKEIKRLITEDARRGLPV